MNDLALQKQMDSYYQRCMTDYRYFAESCLKIKTKTQGLLPLKFNRAQIYLHNTAELMISKYGKVRIIIVKARQQGLSTYVEGRGYWKTIHTPYTKTYILTHEAEATKNLFSMAKRFHENCPKELRPLTKRSNAKELVFHEIDAEYAVGTARTGDTGRSQTVQFFHGCLAEGTKILAADNSERLIENFSVGDEIVTHTGETAKVSFISCQVKACYRITVKGHFDDIVASAEHKFFTKDGKKRLDELSIGDELLFPIQNLSEISANEDFGLPPVDRPQGGGAKEDAPDVVALTFYLGRVLGLYLAEGTIARQYKTGTPSSVYFTVHEDEVERTIFWLSSISVLFSSVSVQHRKNSKSVSVVANGKSFAAFVYRHCGAVDTKRFPRMMYVNTDFAKGLVFGYVAGDGHFEKSIRRVSISSVRERLTYSVRGLLAALGYGWASVQYREAGNFCGRKCQAQWTLRLCGEGVDKLAIDMGVITKYLKPKRVDIKRPTLKVEAGFAHIPILNIEVDGEYTVYDFEIDHPDHSYCLPQCAVANSEVAFWKSGDEISSGLIQGIPEEPGTESYLESTAYGSGGYFHSQWQNACFPGDTPPSTWNGYWRVFIPWFWDDTYQMDLPPGFEMTVEEFNVAQIYDLSATQMCWRRFKIAGMRNDLSKFHRDYPADSTEAFNASLANVLIDAQVVQQCMKAGRDFKYEAVGRSILGVDVAREGDDDTCLVLRKGRVILWYQRLTKMTSTEVAEAVINVMREDHVDHTCIDSTGGYGAGVYDVLVARGYSGRLTGVHFASKAIDNKRYKNKRAEMYFALKTWLEKGAAIPDKEELLVELCAITYKFDATGERLQLERKDEIKKRIGKSTDISDAAALTMCVVGHLSQPQGESFDPFNYYGVT